MTKLSKEREQTALFRFHIPRMDVGERDKFPISVCDRNQQPQTIAKFRVAEDADIFLDARRKRYIRTGE